MSGFTAEEFESDAANTTGSNNAGNTSPAGSNGASNPAGSTAGNSGTGTGSTTSAPGGTTSAAASPTPTEPWPELGAAAYHGIVGEIVRIIAPQTEADPVALLIHILVYAGNAIGRGPYYQVNRDRHFTNLYAALTGISSKGRKGLANNLISAMFDEIDPDWRECAGGGMSSGEGVIHAIRDAIYVTKKGVRELLDPGVSDKRLLIIEPEFSGALDTMKRDGNILSRVIRDAWDCPRMLRTMTKNSQTRASNAFVSIMAHITTAELLKKLDQVSMMNGFANRILFACARRSQELPFGGDVVELTALGARMKVVVDKARAVERVRMTERAEELWREVYSVLSAEHSGLLGAITARAEGHTARLALLYAMLDGVDAIDRVHLEAALALWAFCEASARYIFKDATGDGVADEILAALRAAAPNGLSRTDISYQLNRHRSHDEINRALTQLRTDGKARMVLGTTGYRGGRRKETWFSI